MVSTTGFDRLREFGFSEEDIQGIRTQFHEEQGEGDDAEVALRRREREEEWMNSMASETQEEESKAGKKRGRGREGISQSTLPFCSLTCLDGDWAVYTDMVYGMTVGFLFGILMLFFFKQGIFSSRQQTGTNGQMINEENETELTFFLLSGILLGIVINFSFGVLQWTS